MERFDVYDKNGIFTGRIKRVDERLLPGEYRKHAIVIMKTRDGRYIMQQRSLAARYLPGKWDVTGGGVSSGEDTAQAAVREAREELGIEIDPREMRLFHSEILPWGDDIGGLLDLYGARVDVPEGAIAFDAREVNAVKLVGYDEFAREVAYNKSREFMQALARIEREI